MTQVTDLIDYARAQGVAFFQGKIATGNDLNSARVLAIVPAIKAIEAQEIEFTTELPGLITRAYIDGTQATVSDASMSSAISKTARFLKAADIGFAWPTIEMVGAVIRETNDKAARDVMAKRAFEKLLTLMGEVIARKAMPPREVILATLNPQAVDPSKNEKLAALFSKLGKLAKETATMDMNRYSAMAVEGLRYERLAGEHKALAAREAEHAKPAAPIEAVTPQSNEPVSMPQACAEARGLVHEEVVETTEQDGVDMILAA